MGILPADLGLKVAEPSVLRGVEDSQSIAAIGQSLLGSVGAPMAQYGMPLPRDYENFLGVYPSSIWVYSCVWIISTNASSVPFYLVNNKGEEGAQRVPDIPILTQPNSFMTFPDLLEATHVALELLGNAYWELVGDEAYWVRPDRMRIVPDKRKLVREYVYTVNQQEERFEPEDIVHFKYFNPINDFYGLAPLAAARLSVDSDYDGRKLYRRFFENAAIPASVLETDMPNVSDDVRESLREEIKNLYVGLDRAFEPMILPSGLKWRDVQVKPQDLGVVPLNEMSREEILGCFRVPPILVGLETQNFATAREQRFVFWSSKIQPMHQRFKRIFDQQYLRRLYGDVGVVGKFDYSGISALQDPWRELGDFVTTLKRNGIISANEARAVVNTFVSAKDFQNFDGGDTLYEPLNTQPSGTTTGEEPPQVFGEEPRVEETIELTVVESTLKKVQRALDSRRFNKTLKVREQLMEAWRMSGQAHSGRAIAAGIPPEDGLMVDPGFSDEYEVTRQEKSVKYRELRSKDITVFTSAGTYKPHQRLSEKNGWR